MQRGQILALVIDREGLPFTCTWRFADPWFVGVGDLEWREAGLMWSHLRGECVQASRIGGRADVRVHVTWASTARP